MGCEICKEGKKLALEGVLLYIYKMNLVLETMVHQNVLTIVKCPFCGDKLKEN